MIRRKAADVLFLPTPSARRATVSDDGEKIRLYISTHALREEGDRTVLYRFPDDIISTHALREEGD